MNYQIIIFTTYHFGATGAGSPSSVSVAAHSTTTVWPTTYTDVNEANAVAAWINTGDAFVTGFSVKAIVVKTS